MPYRAECGQETHGRILDSPRKLFNRGGLTEVSINEIMAEAGLGIMAGADLTRAALSDS